MGYETEADRRMQRPLATVDREISELLREEAVRQASGLELIPSENLVSEAVLEAMGRSSRTSMRKGIRENGTTEGASSRIRWSNWRSTAQRSCLGRNTRMCRHTPGHRQT